MKSSLVSIGRKYLPLAMRRKIARYTCWPPVGWACFGSLRRLKPINPDWGSKRGQAIDRYYIEKFLAKYAEDINGRVLEVGYNHYTLRFGGDRVQQSDVLHVNNSMSTVTIVGDLTHNDGIPTNAFDCFILTQTLQFIFDVPTAIRTAYNVLKPGGRLLVTVPGISQISIRDMEQWGQYWSFTNCSVERLFTSVFPPDHVQIETYGNVLTSLCFLHGLVSEELKPHELDHVDPDYQLLITIRAVRPKEAE